MKKIFVSFMIAAMMVVGMAGTFGGVAYAANSVCDDGNIDEAARKAAGCVDVLGTDKTVVPIVLNVINTVLTLAGLVAVIVVIYGGIQYVISTGDTSKTTKAKNAILYGVIGLVVALMSYAIVAFVNLSVLKK